MSTADPADVLIVGAGATGSLAALVLARSGLRVVCLEQGGWIEPSEHPHYRSDWAWQRRTSWNADVNKRHHADDFPVRTDSSDVLMWNAVGGSTNVFGAIWPRYRPSDFRKGDEHGLAPNWPLSYPELAPYYDMADRLVGVSGLPGDPAMPPRGAFPTGPLPVTEAARALAGAFDRLGWHWWPIEAGVISEDYDGRPACNGCGICSGCSRGSMSRYALSIWPKALAAGAKLRTHARALRIDKAADGRAAGVVYADRAAGTTEFQSAKIVVLAANGVGTPRLLLHSGNLANLLHHTLVSAEMWLDRRIDGHMGYVGSLISREFAETDVSRGFVNGFNLNCLTSTGSAAESAAGWIAANRAPWGRSHHQWFERHFGHGLGIHAIGDDLPDPRNRITLDPDQRDSDGLPGARLHYRPGDNDRRMMAYMLDRLTDVGRALGAFEVRLQDYLDQDGIYRTPAWHMIGTCRMGADPKTSVVNQWGQSWDVPNLFLVDGSVLPTGGAVNPTPTISALALRTAEHIRDHFAELAGTN
jgi:choline dehydrogenase-like flavoprotein